MPGLGVRAQAGGHVTAFDFSGSPDPATMEAFFDYSAKLPSQVFLVDIRRLTTLGPEARRVCYRRASEVSRRRIAVVGATGFHRALVGFMVAAMRQQGTRFFKDEAEAMRWLGAGPGGSR